MRVVAFYAAVTVVLVAIVEGLFAVFYTTAADRRALWTSGVVAILVQVTAFAVARRMGKRNAVAGWTIGAVICLATVVVIGLVAPRLGLPLEAALLSLATTLFVTELVEPLLLRA